MKEYARTDIQHVPPKQVAKKIVYKKQADWLDVLYPWLIAIFLFILLPILGNILAGP